VNGNARAKSERREATKIRVGAVLPQRDLVATSGERVQIPDTDRLVHLQFRRYAGCPFCNLHLRSVVERHDEIVAAGIREVAVFHSTVSELRSQQADVPFAVVADPTKRLYADFGVESSARALLDPRAWMPAIRGIRRKHRPFAADLHGGVLGLPADFLIGTDGRVLARKYGEHAYDQWSVDEVLQLAVDSRLPEAPPKPTSDAKGVLP
jgi:peroxiredoxin